MDEHTKIRCTLDALFGRGTSGSLPKRLEFTYSRKNKRIRSVYHEGKLLCTLRTDGGLAITPHLAQMLLRNKRFRRNCLEVDADSKPFIEEGRSVFCAHVVWCGGNVMASSDVPVLYEGKVIAVGRAVLDAASISSMERGVAVRIRKAAG